LKKQAIETLLSNKPQGIQSQLENLNSRCAVIQDRTSFALAPNGNIGIWVRWSPRKQEAVMTNIVRHEITVDQLRNGFGSRLKPEISDYQFEAMAAKFNSGVRWPGDPLPSPGEPGYCKVVEGNDAVETFSKSQ
jgi:hypothetical protein